MLRNTFIHLPGVSPDLERELWKSGVTTWSEFQSNSALPSPLSKNRVELCSMLTESDERLSNLDAQYFSKCLPKRELWRMYADFRSRTAFLDIETTGLSPGSSYITMVGILDSSGFSAYVKDENLLDLREAIEQYDLVVTYNGASFDIPFVEHHFGSIFTGIAHLDLRHPLRRLGYSGGLKSIEKQLDVGRPSELSTLDGYDAVLMWRMWLDGVKEARDTLVRYNAEDVLSLPQLADIVYTGFCHGLPFSTPDLPPFPISEVDLPYDTRVIAELQDRRHRRSRDW